MSAMAKGPHAGGAGAPIFDARAIFNRLDTNHDGKLSFEEFAAGLRQFRQMFAQRVEAMRQPAMAAMGRQGPNVTMRRMGPNVQYFALFGRAPQGRDGMEALLRPERAAVNRAGGFAPHGNFAWMQRGGPRDGFQGRGNFAMMQCYGFNRGGVSRAGIWAASAVRSACVARVSRAAGKEWAAVARCPARSGWHNFKARTVTTVIMGWADMPNIIAIIMGWAIRRHGRGMGGFYAGCDCPFCEAGLAGPGVSVVRSLAAQ